MCCTRSRTVALVAAVACASFAAADEATARYAQAVAAAQADLDAGKVADAKQKLDAAEKALRGFEYEFLSARTRDPKGADPVRTIPAPKVETRYAVLNEVDRQLAFICRDGSLRVFDLTRPAAEPKTVKHEGGAVWSGAFSHDGRSFAAGYEGGEVVVWDAMTWKPRKTVSLGAKWPVRELAVAPDGSAVVAETEKELELWSLTGDAPKKVAGVGPRYNFGEGLAFSPAGDLVATGGMFDVVLHDARTGEKKSSFRHASYTMGLEFSPDGKRIASAPRGNVNKFVGLFTVADGKPVFSAGPFGEYAFGLAFTPDGKRLAVTGQQKTVRLFDTATGEVMLTLTRTEITNKPAFARDGRLLGWSEGGGYRYVDLGK